MLLLTFYLALNISENTPCCLQTHTRRDKCAHIWFYNSDLRVPSFQIYFQVYYFEVRNTGGDLYDTQITYGAAVHSIPTCPGG